MLVVTRKEQDRILVIDEAGIVIVTIEVKQIRRNQVRVGVRATHDLTIVRGELQERDRSKP